MAAAVIKINGVAGSNDDLPINTLVQLDNQNAGGELTFSWAILDQPPGAVNALSATNIQNPTFTPKKEGTYLLKLTVNQTLITEVSQTKIAAIRFLKTRERVAAAGETVENGSRGWAAATERLLSLVDAEAADSGTQVGVVATGAPAVAVGEVLRASATETIKIGLPGQEVLAGWQTTNALLIASVDQMLSVCVGAVDGTAGPYAPGKLIRVRIFGLYTGLVGVPVLGDPVYVSNTGTIVLVPGTVTRQIGNVTRVGGGTYDIWVDGTFSPAAAVSVAPPINVTRAAASAGSGAPAAFNHKHDVDTGVATAITTATLNTQGAGPGLALQDHTHSVTVTNQVTGSSGNSNFSTGAQQQIGSGLVVVAGTYLITFGCRYTGGNNNSVTTFQLRTGATFGASVAVVFTIRDIACSSAGAAGSVEITTIQTLAATTIWVGGTTTAGNAQATDRELIAVRLS